jgi:uncharacterized membrane protein
MLNAFAIILHLVAINIWVGGMFFIIVVLGKVVSTFDIPNQHAFWQHLLKRFFFWVWLAVFGLLGSGIGMIVYRFGDLISSPLYVLLMATCGILMVLVFFIIYFVNYRRFLLELHAGNIEGSRHQLRIIRRLGIVNMVLGLCVMIVIGGGPFLLPLIR